MFSIILEAKDEKMDPIAHGAGFPVNLRQLFLMKAVELPPT
jgi:hypothetical protein